MPLYEYKCGRCGKKFEVIQKFSDTPLTVHEECGGPLEKLLSPPALQFKGSGWYVTDYARGNNSGSGNGKPDSKGEKKETKSETKSESKSESKSDSKSDSKPASTTTDK
jgi:putative FmdB family regulatory protein